MILCCGEALIDMLPMSTPDGREGYIPHAGGAVFNTAITLGRLGVRAGMLTGLSSDIFGQKLRMALLGSHVDVSFAISTNRPTTLAFVQLTDGHAAYSFSTKTRRVACSVLMICQLFHLRFQRSTSVK